MTEDSLEMDATDYRCGEEQEAFCCVCEAYVHYDEGHGCEMCGGAICEECSVVFEDAWVCRECHANA